MDQAFRILQILAAIFLIETFLYNFILPNLPKIPGDIRFEKYGVKLYIPILSSMALSVIATILLNLLK